MLFLVKERFIYMDNHDMNAYNQGPGGPGGPAGPGGGQGGPPGQGNGQDPKRTSLILLAVAAVVTLLCMSFFMRMVNRATNQEISYDEFRRMAEEHEIQEVTWDEDQIYIKPKGEDLEMNGRRLLGPVIRITYYTGNADPEGLGAFELSVPADGRPRRPHGRWKEQCQGLCAKGDRRHL